MKKFKFGIFDFDGTLVDTMPLYMKICSGILKRGFNIPINESEKHFLDSAGTPLNVQYKEILEKNNKPIEKIPEMIDEFFDIANKNEFSFFENAKEIIFDINKKGITLFITTGSQTCRTKERLAKENILKHFAIVLGSDNIPKGAEHIKEFAKAVGLPVEEFSKQAFYCGDGPSDMKLAKLHNIYAIGVAHTVKKEKLLNSGADIVLDEIKEFSIDILKK